jgi:hypothetical protein
LLLLTNQIRQPSKISSVADAALVLLDNRSQTGVPEDSAKPKPERTFDEQEESSKIVT